MAEIAADAWLHPLDGPMRRMPIRDGRVFGAERPGDRPGECRGGHCGVDLGGEVWGEPVHAAHDGVVDRVQRGPNEEHGGLYVRLSHRGGTIFTQYFHLAAIPRWIPARRPRSRWARWSACSATPASSTRRAHLHFTVSVKPSADVTERYIDPEPLVALVAAAHAGRRRGGADGDGAGRPRRAARRRRRQQASPQGRPRDRGRRPATTRPRAAE